MFRSILIRDRMKNFSQFDGWNKAVRLPSEGFHGPCGAIWARELGGKVFLFDMDWNSICSAQATPIILGGLNFPVVHFVDNTK